MHFYLCFMTLYCAGGHNLTCVIRRSTIATNHSFIQFIAHTSESDNFPLIHHPQNFHGRFTPLDTCRVGVEVTAVRRWPMGGRPLKDDQRPAGTALLRWQLSVAADVIHVRRGWSSLSWGWRSKKIGAKPDTAWQVREVFSKNNNVGIKRTVESEFRPSWRRRLNEKASTKLCQSAIRVHFLCIYCVCFCVSASVCLSDVCLSMLLFVFFVS